MWSRTLFRPCRTACRGRDLPLLHLRSFSSTARPFNQHGALQTDDEHVDGASSGRSDPHIDIDIATSKLKSASAISSAAPSWAHHFLHGAAAPAVDSDEAVTGGGESFPDLTHLKLPSILPEYDDSGLYCSPRSGPRLGLDFTPSMKTHEKFGLSHGFIWISRADGTKLTGPDWFARLRHLLRMLDHLCQVSSSPDLPSLVLAHHQVTTILPPDPELVLSLRASCCAKDSVSVRGGANNKLSNSSRLEITLRAWPNTRVLCGDGESIVVPWMQVSIDAGLDLDKARPSPTGPHTIQAELSYLRDIAEMVIQRVTSAMTFDSVSAMLKTVAESLLRVLQFRTPSLEISAIDVSSLKAIRTRPDTQVRATWASFNQESDPSTDRLKRRVEVTLASPSSDFAADNFTIHNDLRTSGVSDENMSVDATKLEDVADLQPVGKHLVFRSDFITYKVQPREFRTSKYQFQLAWPKHLAAALGQLRRSEIFRAADNTLEKASSGSLAGLKHAAESFQRALPGSAKVQFQTFSYIHPQERSEGTESDDAYFCTTYETSTRQLQIETPRFYTRTTRICGPTASKDGLVSARVVLRGDLAATTLTDISMELQCNQVFAAVRDLLGPVIEKGSPIYTKDLKEDCRMVLLAAKKPLAGILSVSHANVKLATVERHKKFDIALESPDLGCKAIVALGSNIGDRVGNVQAACRHIDADPDMSVTSTSALYETRAMYVENQAAFVNGVCEVRTDLEPMQLLDRLQGIENRLGRVKFTDKGPRNIDLDIVTHGDHIVSTERLTIPHELMLEREFVLRPFCDLHPGYRHPVTKHTMLQHLAKFDDKRSSMFPVTPLAPGREWVRSLNPRRRTTIMSILNVTPDSFSDGGTNRPADADALKNVIASQIAAGATIIDIGGQSSRPNAPDVTAEEEIARILPAIRIVQALPEAEHVAISVDTYRADVAEAAINAGAHIINDISAGLLDPNMLPTIAHSGCTYVMMHMRGTPATMQLPEHTNYPDGLIKTIAQELEGRLRAAEEAGIRHWRIILDPGVGFAKTTEQNAELLCRFAHLRKHPLLKTYPWLVGSSRKGFIGELTGAEDPKDRIGGTAATVTAAIMGGAEIIRVHDVKEMARAAKMADAIFRNPREPVKPGMNEVMED